MAARTLGGFIEDTLDENGRSLLANDNMLDLFPRGSKSF